MENHQRVIYRFSFHIISSLSAVFFHYHICAFTISLRLLGGRNTGTKVDNFNLQDCNNDKNLPISFLPPKKIYSMNNSSRETRSFEKVF